MGRIINLLKKGGSRQKDTTIGEDTQEDMGERESVKD